MGKPTCTRAGAHRELCAARRPTLYGGEAPKARCQRDLVSLPSFGGLVDGADLLSGEAREDWCCWKERLLRKTPLEDPSLPARPYSDPALVGQRWEYARFVGQLCDAGLASIGSAAPASVGVFFVTKKAVGNAPAKLRLIFDTHDC